MVDKQLLEEKTAVCEEVAIEMVKGAIKTLNVDYAIAATGIAGPGGGTKENPVGTIWLACGSSDEIITNKLDTDFGRDINIAIASRRAMQLFLQYLNEHHVHVKSLPTDE